MKNKKLGRPNFSREKLGQPNNNSLEEFREQKGTISQNNVMDKSGETFHQIVPEQSSSTSSSITINGEVIGGEEQEEYKSPYGKKMD